jgi:hypothetical protein
MTNNDDTPKPGQRVRHIGLSDPPEYSDRPDVTPAETPQAKAARDRFLQPKTSFPPTRSSSMGIAVSLIGMAASSAAGIENPLHRTLAICLIVGLVYFIGLRTQ